LTTRILDLTQVFFIKEINPDTMYAGKFYVDGNMIEGSPEASERNWEWGVQKATEQQKKYSKADQPFYFEKVVTHSAKDAYQLVLKNAGALLPTRDDIDARIVNEVKTGICKYGGKYGEGSGIIDTQKTVGGWPELKTYNIKKDADGDGIPDDWEKARGLNPNDAGDASMVKLHSYYSNIEVYINSFVK